MIPINISSGTKRPLSIYFLEIFPIVVFKAMLGGAIASWLTASIVGILI